MNHVINTRTSEIDLLSFVGWGSVHVWSTVQTFIAAKTSDT